MWEAEGFDGGVTHSASADGGRVLRTGLATRTIDGDESRVAALLVTDLPLSDAE